MLRHFTDLFDLSAHEARALIDRALELKRAWRQGVREPRLAGRTLGLLFEKPSLRTRVSFESAIAHLGGAAIFLPGKEVGLGSRETVTDFARVLSQYVDCLAARTFSQQTVEELARHATIPVINALSDTSHPCQAMADLMTVREAFGATEGVKVAFVGDGNNVARSLAVACALLGSEFALGCPPGYGFPDDFRARFAAAFPGLQPRETHDAREAVAHADVIYTDVWASMGQEDEAEARRVAFAAYRVDDALLSRAAPDVVFLHCLPAHRGEEVTAEVLDGPRSLVIPQAANRMHFQKSLLLWLLDESGVLAPPREVKAARRRSKTG